MSLPQPVAVSGARGRLGRALVEAVADRGMVAIEWSRPDYDLDDPGAAARLIERDRPAMVIHPAAWTDVDGCARYPDLAQQRNGTATGALAAACAAAGIGLALVSTNEVFDGGRTDGRPYSETDEARPINAYGASKLLGESLARDAYRTRVGEGLLWTIRTAWLFGPPGNDFPAKVVAAADRLPDGEALPVVADEFGSPTYTRDVAPAILALVERAPAGLYHLAADGPASRFDVALAVLAECRPRREVRPISRDEFARPSRPPAWAPLDSGRAAGFGVTLRPWSAGLADYLSEIC